MLPRALQRISCLTFKNVLPISSKKKCIQAGVLKLQEKHLAVQNCSRKFQTSALRLKQDPQRQVATKIMTITNPFKYISLKIKTILMRGYFDENFSEKEFLRGTRQAIVYVSDQISKGNLNNLKELLTQEGMDCVKKLFSEHGKDSEVLKVEDSDIMTLTLNDLGFEYGEAGRKWAYALVVCYCAGKDSFSKQASDFEFEILVSQPRIIKYSFCCEYTPGAMDGWLIDQIDHVTFNTSANN